MYMCIYAYIRIHVSISIYIYLYGINTCLYVIRLPLPVSECGAFELFLIFGKLFSLPGISKITTKEETICNLQYSIHLETCPYLKWQTSHS